MDENQEIARQLRDIGYEVLGNYIMQKKGSYGLGTINAGIVKIFPYHLMFELAEDKFKR